MSVAERWTLVGLAPAILTSAGPCLAADLAYGQYLAAECVTCHRVAINDGVVPSIVGLPTQSFVNALRDYRAGRRIHPVMQNVARSLGDEEIQALAAYFASFKGGGSGS